MPIANPNLFVITGAPGAGKTTLLNVLVSRGFACVPEVARQIIQEQQSSNGDALPWGDTTAYIHLMLHRSIASFLEHKDTISTTFFDRGLPDTLGYAQIIQLADPHPIQQACTLYRYANPVFVARPWRKIYITDDQRKQTFEEAVHSFNHVVDVYQNCRYRTLELPQASPDERADFVVDNLR